MKLNMKKLKEAIRDIHREIRDQNGDGPSGPPTAYRLKVIQEQIKLNAMKYSTETIEFWKRFRILCDARKYATVLYSIRANNRNKLHQQKIRNPRAGAGDQPKNLPFTLEEQQRLIAPFIYEFEQQIETVR